MTYAESRARYAEVLDAVTNDREEIVITRAEIRIAACRYHCSG